MAYVFVFLVSVVFLDLLFTPLTLCIAVEIFNTLDFTPFICGLTIVNSIIASVYYKQIYKALIEFPKLFK